MVDDERLQELLAKASSLYNNGEYKGAIDTWQEALGVDPASQKAKEGIRMATLLLGDSEPLTAPEATKDAGHPADGGDPAAADLPPEEAEARVDLGIARVKQLLAERKYAEAIEGAQGLLPLAQDSREIQRLLEDAQHAFESTPFIEEHLTLAHELLAQERFSEAEAECKKIFTLDAVHPGGKALLKEIRDRIQASLKDAASQLGGMTVKLTRPPALAAGVKFTSRGSGEISDPSASDPAASPLSEVFSEPGQEGGEGLPQAPDPDLEAAFAPPVPEGAVPEESPFELAGDFGLPAPTEAAEEIVEAKTVRPVASRVVPKAPSAADPLPDASEPQGIAETPFVAKTEAPVEAPPVLPAHPKKTSPLQSTAPAHASVDGKSPRPHPPQAKEAKPETQENTAAWEQELTQLNLKDKEHGLLRGTGAKVTTPPSDAGDMDLMSLLDSGGMPGLGGPEGVEAAPKPEAAPAVQEPAKPKEPSVPSKPQSKKKASVEGPATHAAPVVAQKLRAAQRPKPVPVKRRSSKLKYLLLLLILLGGGAAAWQLNLLPRDLDRYLPRLLGGGGQAVVPPAGSPSGTVDGAHNPIPTPIGGTSRQQALPAAQDGTTPSGATTASLGGSAAGAATAAPQASGAIQNAGGPAPAAGAAGPGQAPSAGAPGPGTAPGAAPGAKPSPSSNSNEPIKPSATPAMSRAEMQSKIATYSADGKRLLAQGKWREARAKFNAVLALDPANIEIKELADKAQVKIDEDQGLMNEFDSMKSLFAEKDYENALRKLYRLPRDKGLGDIDLYIRNAWFNWAVVLMKAGNSKDALVKLSEELAVDPDDTAALKLQEVAEKYTARAKDRTYYAFTEALVLRPFDKR